MPEIDYTSMTPGITGSTTERVPFECCACSMPLILDIYLVRLAKDASVSSGALYESKYTKFSHKS